MLRVIILVIAIGAGGLAGWLVLSTRAREVAVAPAAPVAQTKTEILVAAGDLVQGQALDEKSLRWQSWPKDSISVGFISREAKPDALTSITGALVRSHFVSGEPIREEKLSRGPAGMLASMLPSGKRAVAIRVSAESTAGGFILPNDRVDVIQNVSSAAGEGKTENTSRTLLRNVRVLAVDQKADETKGQLVVVGKTATLEVTPTEAEIIASAQAAGTLSLALRSIADLDEKPIIARESSVNVRVFRAGKSEDVKVRSEGTVVQ
ncbi:Flp pilus assembly protein CpaB [Microvirga brassicacearum]|uniref:Flp pilus assembly protein CpaB n=1 Tax=Microvirga brassicacearum TaxID=2580413 RepID=A0A5N3P7N7_9HYPH|nr:Flp pilus assembly protein CpaB [Microvirga brassicacearum]KAB0265758.1 Flp pilus assembly protein CpaB [Microvirga brassicacearum]